jgi:hypothetical protein
MALAACTRPLTDNEVTLARDVFGDQIDVSKVRIGKDLALIPPPNSARIKVSYKRAGNDFCARGPTPPRTEAPPGVAIGNTIHLRSDVYQADAGLFWPDRLVIPHNFVFVHELVHVWQWQNREQTGYSPLTAIREGMSKDDAYFYEPGQELRLDDFGYEQQAAIIEDYLCHVMFDPQSPRRDLLRAVLAPVLPIDHLDARIDEVRN